MAKRSGCGMQTSKRLGFEQALPPQRLQSWVAVHHTGGVVCHCMAVCECECLAAQLCHLLADFMPILTQPQTWIDSTSFSAALSSQTRSQQPPKALVMTKFQADDAEQEKTRLGPDQER